MNIDINILVPQIRHEAKADLKKDLVLKAPLNQLTEYTKENFNNCIMVAAPFAIAYDLIFNPRPRSPADYAAIPFAPLIFLYGLSSFPPLVVSAIGTAILAPAYAAECLGKKVIGLASPSESRQQREHLTQQFINRILELLPETDLDKMNFFLHHPEQLINIAIIQVAFLSRREAEGVKVGDTLLTLDQIKNQDEVRQQYFNYTCEMKKGIFNLSLNPDDDKDAWENLMRLFSNSQHASFKFPESIEDEWVVIMTPEEYLQRMINLNPEVDANILRILIFAIQFNQEISSDEVFKALWKQSSRR